MPVAGAAEAAVSPKQQAAITVASAKRLAAQNAAATPTPPPGGTDFNTALKQAQAMAASDISAQVAPLQSQIDYQQHLLPQEQGALTSEFNNLLPYAQQAALGTAQFNKQASDDAQQIFQQAGTNLNTMQQNNAAQAQRMAQQIGGPVSTGQFTSALEPYQTAIGQGASVAGLNSLELGTIGTDQAQQFAGQTLPAMAAEQHSTVAANIQDQIQKLKDQITTVQGTKSKLVDARLPALLTAAHNYRLSVAQLAEKKLQDTRAFKALQTTLTQKGETIELAKEAQSFNECVDQQKLGQSGQALTLTQGELDLGNARLTQQAKDEARKYGLDYLKYSALAAHYIRSDATSAARVTAEEQKNAASLINVALGGSTSNKPVTMTVRHYLTANDPLMQKVNRYAKNNLFGKSPFPTGVYYDKSTGKFYTMVHQTETPQHFMQTHGMSGTPTQDPNQLYKFLTGSGVDATMAANIIRLRLGIPKWNPGDKITSTAPPKKTAKTTAAVVNPTNALGVTGNAGSPEQTYSPGSSVAANLAKMPIGQLTTLAEKYGFKPSPVKTGRQALIDFIYHATNK